MRRSWLTALCFAALATGCGAQPAGQPTGQPERGGDVVAAELVAFDPQGYASGALGGMSNRPIDVGAFQGWFRAGSSSAKDIKPRQGVTYIVVAGVTGCRLAERAELVRDGDDLYARFTGGEDHSGQAVGCARDYGPVAEFAVAPDAVRGVRTVGGASPVDANGPGLLNELIDLGPAPIRDGPKAAQTATDAAGEVSRLLHRSGSTNLDKADAALRNGPTDEFVGFAFVLTGCAERSAVLIVNHSAITAKLTGDTDTRCVAANNFLAVFAIDAQRVPPNAKVG